MKNTSKLVAFALLAILATPVFAAQQTAPRDHSATQRDHTPPVVDHSPRAGR